MIALYLIAAHMVGDFVLATRGQAANKLTDARYRARHVATYTLCFVPVAAWYSPSPGRTLDFLLVLYVWHFLTDSVRFHSTLGDWIVHEARWLLESRRRGEWVRFQRRNGHETRVRKPALAPNPWTPLPILIDQSLHAVQLAVLGGLLLT